MLRTNDLANTGRKYHCHLDMLINVKLKEKLQD